MMYISHTTRLESSPIQEWYFNTIEDICVMAESQLQGSGGYVVADISDAQAKKADLGVGKLFLAPIGKLEQSSMLKYYCNNCDTEFPESPNIRVEESENEEVADNLILVERGEYTCKKCDSVISVYRVLEQRDDKADVGKAHPS